MMNINKKRSQLPHEISSKHKNVVPTLNSMLVCSCAGVKGNHFLKVLFKVCYIHNLNMPRIIIVKYLENC